jgi:regulator of sigma E protease
MLGEDQDNPDPRSFNSKSVFKRIAVIVFGPIMNLLLAYIIFCLVITQVPLLSTVVDNKPAQKAGIVVGDRIVAINQIETPKWEQVTEQITKSGGNQIHVKVENKGIYREADIKPVLDPTSNRYVIGIAASYAIEGFSLKQGSQTTGTVLVAMVDFLGRLIRGRASSDEVSGPVGIIYYMNEAAKSGYIQVLFMTAILSINLFLLNLLPIPALDGGRLVFLVIEAIRRKPVNPEKEGMVHFIGFVALMALSVLIIYRDLIKFDVLKNLFR